MGFFTHLMVTFHNQGKGEGKKNYKKNIKAHKIHINISSIWLINPLSRIWKRYKILQAFSLEIVFLRLASLSLSTARTVTSGDEIACDVQRAACYFSDVMMELYLRLYEE